MKRLQWGRGRWAGVALVTALFVQQWRLSSSTSKTATTKSDVSDDQVPSESAFADDRSFPASGVPSHEFQNIPIEADEPNIKLWFARADAAMQQGRIDDAETAWLAVLRLDPEHKDALAELGFLHVSLRADFDQAIDYLSRALDLDPENQEVAHELSMAYMKQGQIDLGIHHFQECAERFPESEPLHYVLATMLAQKGQHDLAIRHWQRVVDLTDDKVRARRDLATAFRESGNLDQAIKVYEDIESELLHEAASIGHSALLRDEWARARMSLVQVLIQLGRLEEAEDKLLPLERSGEFDQFSLGLRKEIDKAKSSG